MTGRRTQLEIHVGPVTGSELVRDYYRGTDALAPFFAAFPFDPEAYQRKADAVHARMPRGEREPIAASLQPTTDAARSRLARILAGDGVVVTTGQQTGLFGGPLYTIYKILTAVRLAATIEARTGQPCLAVFWVAADDHDWAEVNHVLALDAENRVRRIELAGADEPPVAMSARQFGDEIGSALDALAALLPPSEFAGPLLDLLRQAYRPGTTMAVGFRELLAALLARFDLALLDPTAPVVKQRAARILEKELRETVHHNQLLARQSDRLVAAGYHAQVNIVEDVSNVFLHDALGRERLVREDGDWLLRRTKRVFPDAELMALLASEPARFSPNVLLRPVVESALLPAVAYVGGPAEIGYFAQIGCLFSAHGVEPPIVFPRFGATIVEAKVRKVLDKFGLSIEDVQHPFHEVVTRIVRDELPAGVTGSLGTLRTALHSGYDRLANAATEVDPTLRGSLVSMRNQALGQLDAAEKKITSHLKKRSEVEIEQLRKAAANLYPDGAPQERVLNVVPFLARYGQELLEDMADAMQIRLEQPNPRWSGVRCEP
jgi:bacillithiol biosynthesis cysteine-adding enzyme BshC